MHIHIHIHIRIHINEKGQKGLYIYSGSPFSGKRRARETCENSGLSRRKKHATNIEDYRVKWERQKKHKSISIHIRIHYIYIYIYMCQTWTLMVLAHFYWFSGSKGEGGLGKGLGRLEGPNGRQERTLEEARWSPSLHFSCFHKILILAAATALFDQNWPSRPKGVATFVFL